jgi:ribulose bisphosphate carboxylase small subunit
MKNSRVTVCSNQYQRQYIQMVGIVNGGMRQVKNVSPYGDRSGRLADVEAAKGGGITI